MRQQFDEIWENVYSHSDIQITVIFKDEFSDFGDTIMAICGAA
jgi:hypothetical protein